MLNKNVILKGTITGKWYQSTAPNGSVTCTERRIYTIEIYEADFYGRGSKQYVYGYQQIEVQGGAPGPVFGNFDSGNLDDVNKWTESLRAAMLEEGATRAPQMIASGRLLNPALVTFVHGGCGHVVSSEAHSEVTAGKKITVVGSRCLSCSVAARAAKELADRQARATEIENLDPRDFFMPDDEWISSLSVGDDAPYVFGWSKVVEIKYRGVDIYGRPFVGYTVDFGNGSTMSASAKSGMLQRTMTVCNMNSSELDRLELALRERRGDTRAAGRC